MSSVTFSSVRPISNVASSNRCHDVAAVVRGGRWLRGTATSMRDGISSVRPWRGERAGEAQNGLRCPHSDLGQVRIAGEVRAGKNTACENDYRAGITPGVKRPVRNASSAYLGMSEYPGLCS